MKHRNNLTTKDETNSLTLTGTESRSMLLGEEASTNRVDLYYENQKNLLKAHFEQSKQRQKERLKSSKKEPIKSTYLPRTAPARLEKQAEIQKPNLLKEVSALNLSSVRNTSIRFSAREKMIMDWAFKRFEDEGLKTKMPRKRKKNRFEHEFWFEDDRDTIKGAIYNKDIILDDENELENNFDFYRTQRKAFTTKTDIEINRQIKQLDTKLIDLSKERFKVLNVLEYEKKKFVRNQLLKSESLPGLRCVALLNENPDYRFKRPGKVTSFEKVHQLSSNEFEKTFVNLPDINAPYSTSVETPKSKIKMVPLMSDDKKLFRSNTMNVLVSSQQQSEIKNELAKIEFTRSKTDNQIRSEKTTSNDNTATSNNNNNTNNNNNNSTNMLPDHSVSLKVDVTNSNKNETARPKTGTSDRTKLKSSKTNEIEKSDKATSKQQHQQQHSENENSNSNESSKSEFIESKSSKSQTNLNQEDSNSNNKVKSILKQRNTLKINTAEQRTIVFDEKSTNSLNRVRSGKSYTSSRPDEGQFTSLDIMVGVISDGQEENDSQLNSTTSFNMADTVITNEVVSSIGDQTLAANIKLVNDYMELEDDSFEMNLNQLQNENVDDLMESFIKARAKNVSSLSEPYPKLAEEDVLNERRSADDSVINLKLTSASTANKEATSHKVSFKLTNESVKKSDEKKSNEVKKESEAKEKQTSAKENEKGQKMTINRRPKLSNSLPRKALKTVILEQIDKSDSSNPALDTTITSNAASLSLLKLDQFNDSSASYSHMQTFISPIQDNRFTDFISVVKPAYIVKETKDVKKIIEKNDALKSINIDIETREKMNKVKERGSKLAIKARQILASGEYGREFIQ